MLEHALKYAALGWNVFPLQPRGKPPITAHGVKDATTEEAQICDWWDRWPNANTGLACGAASGVYVIDVDVDQEKGINGYDSLRQLGELPVTVCQRTPRGGAHFLLSTDNAPANKNGLRPGIDIRGDGYYVVLAPSVHPNGGVYQWAPGCSPWDVALALYPDFMRVGRVRANISDRNGGALPVQPRQTIVVQSNGHSNDEGLGRARVYFERVEPAIQGNRGHDCLLWAAQCCVNGLRMSDQEAYAFLAAEYNPRCVPPWDLSEPTDEKDFRRKISEARKHPTNKFPAGWILDDPAYATLSQSTCAVDTQALLASVVTIPVVVEKPKANDSKRLPDAFRWPVGWLGEYVGYCMETAPHPNLPLALGGGLALYSAATGRKIVGPSGLPTNIYVSCLALPGTGKNFPRTLNAQILEQSGGLGILADKVASAEGIEDRLSESPVLLIQPDEMDSLISAMESGRDSRSLAIGAILNQLYTSSAGIYMRRIKSIVQGAPATATPIIRPHVALFGTATPQLYYAATGRRLLEGGFVARTLVFEADRRSEGRRGSGRQIPQRLIDEIKYWLEYTPPGEGDIGQHNNMLSRAASIVPVSDCGSRALEACQVHADSQYSRAEQVNSATAASVWSRVYEQTEKLATIYAISRDYRSPSIDKEAVDWANGIVTWSARRSLALAAEYSADSPFAESCQRFLRLVEQLGGTATRKQVADRLRMKVRDIDEIVTACIDRGCLTAIANDSKRGPRQIIYQLLGQANNC